ncbi:toxin-antitoxin system HicB family antitoxin [Arvimicrobium flavum]|uniref:toxin-antitoxin system HicB family antitoxin n=1 Tax=Arvimicrobium flavum TaxID=3393320 RepID=UPI00237A306D|nr:toxin-antitoxin system HicB family antitoxin [Mesorhizobium shangrilense]
MSKATYPLKLPSSIKEAATRLAKKDGVSLNQWIASAVAQKVGSVDTAEEFLKRKAGDADGSGMLRFLDLVADRPPLPDDEIRR